MTVQALIEPRLVSEITARILLQTGAVLFNVQKPFIFTSGWASPVYIDCRRIISYPALRQVLIGFAADAIETRIGLANIDSVVGGEAAGIPFAAWIADALRLPMQFVRNQHGSHNPDEGMLLDDFMLATGLLYDAMSAVR